MSLITLTNDLQNGATADADEVMEDFKDITNIVNGSLDESNISSTAALSIATLSVTGAITSTLATGTAPFTVASTTVVSNLNADQLDGYEASDFATVITTITSSATPTPVRASKRTVLKITAQSEALELQNPTGIPQEGDLLKVEVTDDGTGRAITYDTGYADGTAERATSTTASTRLMQIFEYSGSSWKCEHSAEDV